MCPDNSSSVSFEIPLGSVDQARDALETLRAMITVGYMVVETGAPDAVMLAELRRVFTATDDQFNGRPDNPENSPRGWADA